MVGTLGYFVVGRTLLSAVRGEQEQNNKAMKRRGITAILALGKVLFLKGYVGQVFVQLLALH